jgi:hypothetical protein
MHVYVLLPVLSVVAYIRTSLCTCAFSARRMLGSFASSGTSTLVLACAPCALRLDARAPLRVARTVLSCSCTLGHSLVVCLRMFVLSF